MPYVCAFFYMQKCTDLDLRKRTEQGWSPCLVATTKKVDCKIATGNLHVKRAHFHYLKDTFLGQLHEKPGLLCLHMLKKKL